MTEPKSKVFYAPQLDGAMADATRRARRSFKYLWRELTWEYRRIIPGLELSAIKAPFADADGNTEHMWLGDIAFDGDLLSATLLNEPNHVRSVKAGDVVTLTPAEIDDWMYVQRGKVYGGFTIQALRKNMAPSQRSSHDTAWGFDFGDPDVVPLVPDSSAKRPGLVARWLGTAVPPADPEAEHPMSENVAAEFAREIARNRQGYLEDVGPDGLTTLHSLALGGSAGCVRVLLEEGADASRRTRSGKTALDLAVQMDWPRVVALLQTTFH